MDDLELEKEFEARKAMHKYAILAARMMKYFRDLDTTNPILEFVSEEDKEREYEEKAVKEIKKILALGDKGVTFNRFYEIAWKECANFLP